MDGWKKWMLALVAVLMVLFFILSSTDLLVRKDKQEIKKVSVIASGESSSVGEDFRRGIQEAANEDRVEVNYIAFGEEGETWTQTELIEREWQRGAQAVILVVKDRGSMEQYLAGKQDMAPLITVNSFGNYDHELSRILFDTDAAAERLVQEILKQEGRLKPVTCLTGESQISAEVYKSLKKALAAEGIEPESMTLSHAVVEGEGIFIGCGQEETEELISKTGEDKRRAIYGIGHSDTILKEMEAGSVKGIMAYSMYSVGVHAVREAVNAIDEGYTEETVFVPCKLITRENLKEEQRFLFPIH